MDVSDVQEYVRLRRRQKELDAELDGVRREADQLEQALLESFSLEGLDRMTVDSTTVYLHRQLWAKAADTTTRQNLLESLKSVGLGHFVHETVNFQTLSSYVRDLDREGEPVPEGLQDDLDVAEVYRLRTRRT